MNTPTGRFTTVAVTVCAIISGAAVMIYEFLAVRILQRYFGGSLDVWASEIAVCLGGLAVGYSLGGMLADRFRSWKCLGVVLIAAGGSALLIEPLALRISTWLLNSSIGEAWHPLLASAVSSFLPILFLGTVQPQLIRLRVHDMARLGTGAGRVASVSTMGSILGVLLLVRILAFTGVIKTLVYTSVILVVLGVALAAFGRVRLLAAFLALLLGGVSAADVVYENYSAYHHIVVMDDDSHRFLWFDNDDCYETRMSLKDPYEGGFEYTDFFHVPLLLDPTINAVLFLGLGGGTGPKSFYKRYPAIHIEAAEIDPAVVKVARDYFYLPEDPRLNVFTRDGRVHLRRSKKRYGAILMDAYATSRYGPYIPYHMTTREFFELAWSRLLDGGCFVHNVIGSPGNDYENVARDIQCTLEAVFPIVYAFRAKSSNNTVFVAVRPPSNATAGGQPAPAAWPRGPWLEHPLDANGFRRLSAMAGKAEVLPFPLLAQRVTQLSKLQDAPRTGEILTDDFAPVDLGTLGK